MRKFFIVCGISILTLAVTLSVIAWRNDPSRTMHQMVDTIEQHQTNSALAMIDQAQTIEQQVDMRSMITDWSAADVVDVVIESGVADLQTDVSIPAHPLWAHRYTVIAHVRYDDSVETVRVILRRDTKNSSARLRQIFFGWRIAHIEDVDDWGMYQNL